MAPGLCPVGSTMCYQRSGPPGTALGQCEGQLPCVQIVIERLGRTASSISIPTPWR
jgi:hypothetical protein